MINSPNSEMMNKQNFPYQTNDLRQNFSAQNELSQQQKLKEKVQDKASDNFVGKAVAADKQLDTLTYFKNFALCILMSLGFTHGTNWLCSSPKELNRQITNIDDFKQTRMYKIGTWFDKYIGGNPVLKTITKTGQNTKKLLKKIPIPNFIREIGTKIKMGTRSQWDKTGNYTLGKGAEAMNEAIEFFAKAPIDEIKRLGFSKENRSKILSLLKDYNKGLKTGAAVYKEITTILDKIPASKLAALSISAGVMDKWFKTFPNLNMALHKAKFFNGIFNTTQGATAKGTQKLISLIGEASGGGVLGGGMALFMNAIGLMTGFNAAAEAEKGDKLSAFMEDYIGYTLGGYLMSFVMGKCMHKALGVAELGLDPEEIKRVGEKLGVDMTRGCLNDVVIAHNKMFTRTNTIESTIKGLDNGSLSVKQALKKIRGLYFENINFNDSTLESISKEALSAKLKQEAKDLKSLDELSQIAKEIKHAYKSKLTLKSIFSGTDKINKGNFIQRLCRYLTHKPLGFLGKIASIGKYDLFANCNPVIKKLKFIKRLGGGIARMIFVITVLTPIWQKFFSKISHKIFGKPQKSRLEDEKNADKKQSKQQEIEKILAPSKPDGTNALGMTQDEVKLLKSKGLKDEEIIQAGVYIQAQKQQIQQILNTTDKNGVNAVGLTQQEMKALRDKGLKDTEILQVAAYKKQQQAQIQRQKEIAAAPAIAAHSLLKNPIASSSIKGYQASSDPKRRYVPGSRCNIRPASVPQNLIDDMNKADINIQNALETLDEKEVA